MSVTDGFAGHRAQTKTLIGIEAAALQATVVEGQRLRLDMLEIEFAVIGAGERLGQHLAHRRLVAVEQVDEIGVHGRCSCLCLCRLM